MSDPVPETPPQAGPPTASYPPPALSRSRWRRLSVVWLVPLVALLAGGTLAVRALLQRGPEITIAFRSAEGLEAGRTEVRFKEVVVGRVDKVRLAGTGSHRQVLVDVKLDKGASSLAVEDSRFWVVRPRVGTGGVSGLGTLLSGAYIGVDAGSSEKSATSFTGLESPPLLRDEPGRSFTLVADDLGALDIGSPVYYRRTRVGRVVGYDLDPKTDTLNVQVFIEEPNDQLVTVGTKFWNASGVDLSLNASGLTLNTQSIASVLLGGVAFANLDFQPQSQPPRRAAEGEKFYLYANQRAALAPPDGAPLRVRMLFRQSLRGLAVGAPIDLLGVDIGTVRTVAVRYDAGGDDAARQFPIEVTADLYLARLGDVRSQLFKPGEGSDALLLKRLVDSGFRAQVRTGNLLTGQLYVALDFMPRQPKESLDAHAEMPTLPTVPGALSELQPQIAEIITRVGKIRFDEIGANLNTTLKGAAAAAGSLQQTLAAANAAIGALTPEAQRSLAEVRRTLESAQGTLGALQGTVEGLDRNVVRPDAPVQREAARTLLELQRAAQALRALSDYLQRHPESLLRGKPPDPDLSRGGVPANAGSGR